MHVLAFHLIFLSSFLAVSLLAFSPVHRSMYAKPTSITYHKQQSLHHKQQSLQFKKPSNDEGSSSSNKPQGLLRFLPEFLQAKFQKTYSSPLESAGNRYQLNLLIEKASGSSSKRHVVTRLIRFLPDMSWSSAEDVVENALVDGKALLRVMSSKAQCEEIVKLLAASDPPVRVEVWDSKTEEVVLL